MPKWMSLSAKRQGLQCWVADNWVLWFLVFPLMPNSSLLELYHYCLVAWFQFLVSSGHNNLMMITVFELVIEYYEPFLRACILHRNNYQNALRKRMDMQLCMMQGSSSLIPNNGDMYWNRLSRTQEVERWRVRERKEREKKCICIYS